MTDGESDGLWRGLDCRRALLRYLARGVGMDWLVEVDLRRAVTQALR